MTLQRIQDGSAGAPVAQLVLKGPDGRPLELADTIDCKLQLRQWFQAESMRLSLGKPEVGGGCPGACPEPQGLTQGGSYDTVFSR
jgi:hypothetical protein